MSNHAYNQSAFCVLNFDLRLRTQDLWSIQNIQKNQNMSQVSSKRKNRCMLFPSSAARNLQLLSISVWGSDWSHHLPIPLGLVLDELFRNCSTKKHKLPKSETISQTTPPNVFRYRDRLMFVYDVSHRAWFENVQRKVNQQNQTKQRLLQHRSCRKQIRLEGESCWCWRTHLKSPLNNINADNKNTIFNVCIADLTNYPLLSKLKKQISNFWTFI